MYAVDGAVGKLLCAEVAPVDVSAVKRLPSIRIVGYILLNVVILEKNDVGKSAVFISLCRSGNSALYIGRTRNRVDNKVKVRVLCLISLCSRLKSGDVEVGIPSRNRKSVRVIGSTAEVGGVLFLCRSSVIRSRSVVRALLCRSVSAVGACACRITAAACERSNCHSAGEHHSQNFFLH